MLQLIVKYLEGNFYMKRSILIKLTFVIFLIAFITINPAYSITTAEELQLQNSFFIDNLTEYQKSRVAHAGGALEGNTYLNCYDAIKQYYEQGIRLFELDVEYTTDNKPVMLHSWDGFQWKYFGLDRNKKCTYEEFMNAKMINNYTPLSVAKLSKYMKEEFPEMFWVTDTKQNNKLLLLVIAFEYPELLSRIIPQVYNIDEYYYAKNVGFENIILTLYNSNLSDKEIISLCKTHHPFAITMPISRALDSKLSQKLSKENTYVYTHTVNDVETFKKLQSKGVKGIYTDILF